MDLYNIEELLVKQNPHWASEGIDHAGFERDIFADFSHELTKNKLILTINGPRRSGKTFLMKQGIDWLVKKHNVSTQNICYFQFSGSLNKKDILNEVVDLFSKKYGDNESEKYIFLDEVQYIDYWQDQIKSLYDTLPNTKFILSGSTSLFFRQKSNESLAGRIYKLSLGALNFHEYLRFKNIEEPSSKNRAKFVANLPIYRSEFRKYLSFGQYPEIVANPEIDAKKYIQDLADQIINFDIPYLNSKIDRQLFLGLIKTLSFDLAEEFSVSNVANALETDRRIIADYIKILQETNLFNICYNNGFKSMRKKISGSKKIYSLNLNLSLNINGFDASYLNDNRVYGKYFENYIYMRILEKYKTVEYFRVKGKELDFVTSDSAFEIKSGKDKNIDKYIKISESIHKEFNWIDEEEAFLI